jgi:hypothetical protein
MSVSAPSLVVDGRNHMVQWQGGEVAVRQQCDFEGAAVLKPVKVGGRDSPPGREA